MHFHVENYDHETIFSLMEHEDVITGQALKSYLKSMQPLNKLPCLSPVDLTDVDVKLTEDWITWYGDAHSLYLEMLGENKVPEGNNHFASVVQEAVILLKNGMSCNHFELVSVGETHLVSLNRYNVMFTLKGEYNRMLVFSLGEEFAQVIAKKMIDESVDKVEREQLVKASVAEMGNMIVGLSLKHILPYGDVKMSTPIFFEVNGKSLISSTQPLNIAVCSSCGDAFKVYGVNFG